MKEKPINIFFGAVSWIIWAATISVIVFAVVLLATGMEKPPVFTLNDARLSAVAADDAALAENGKTGDDWLLLELDMTVAGAKYSPFSYTAETFALKAPADLKDGEWFVTVDAPLSYSKIAPDDYTLRLYIRSPGGEAALMQRITELGFGLRGLDGHFTFIKYPFRNNLPGFYLSEFTLPQSLTAA